MLAHIWKLESAHKRYTILHKNNSSLAISLIEFLNNFTKWDLMSKHVYLFRDPTTVEATTPGNFWYVVLLNEYMCHSRTKQPILSWILLFQQANDTVYFFDINPDIIFVFIYYKTYDNKQLENKKKAPNQQSVSSV